MTHNTAAALPMDFLPCDRSWRSRAVPLALMMSDVIMAVTSLLFPGALGLGMPHVSPMAGWLAILALCWMVGHFATRGHYTSRIPFWNEVGSVTAAAATGFAIEAALCLVLSRRGFDGGEISGWVLLVPAVLAGRQAVRTILARCGFWRLRAVVTGDPSLIASAEAALPPEPALGHEMVGNFSVEDAGDPEPIGSRLHVLLLSPARPAALPIWRAAKVAFDKLVAALLLLLLMPLFIVIASFVRSDGGPALFAHGRVGAKGHLFPCFKFRTMVMDADRMLSQVLETDAAVRAEWGATQKLRNDPRITQIGQFLRKTSLDELPQLINILRGEMSLVGPRPIVEAEIVRYGRDIEHYYEARPGMTGLWQVSGRSDTSYQRRVQLDTWYVKNWSLWRDLTILLKTIPAIISGGGAA